MEITWYGQTCFRLKDRNVTVAIDPFNPTGEVNKLISQANIITLSSQFATLSTQIADNTALIQRPGEYEVQNVFVYTVYLPPKKEVPILSKSNIFVIYMDDLTIAHLGGLTRVPTQSQVESLGNIDILLLPIDGEDGINTAQAAEVISLVEPFIVIPMAYKPDTEALDKFMKEMGVSNLTPTNTFKVTRSQLPEEAQLVLLEVR